MIISNSFHRSKTHWLYLSKVEGAESNDGYDCTEFKKGIKKYHEWKFLPSSTSIQCRELSGKGEWVHQNVKSRGPSASASASTSISTSPSPSASTSAQPIPQETTDQHTEPQIEQHEQESMIGALSEELMEEFNSTWTQDLGAIDDEEITTDDLIEHDIDLEFDSRVFDYLCFDQ